MDDGSLRTDDYIDDVLEQYSDMVYRLALSQTNNKADAEDVFQEVFIRFISYTASFESEEHKKAWLLRVTINCSRKLRSSAWFRRTVPLEISNEPIHFDTLEKSIVYDAILSLPNKYRTVVHLFYYEDMSISQISSLLNIKESTVKSQLFRARKMLKNQLKGDFDDE